MKRAPAFLRTRGLLYVMNRRAVGRNSRGDRAFMAAILEMHGISKTFPGVKALKDVNLTVKSGEIHAICGENGAGKSTLMKVLSGVYHYPSYEGKIIYE